MIPAYIFLLTGQFQRLFPYKIDINILCTKKGSIHSLKLSIYLLISSNIPDISGRSCFFLESTPGKKNKLSSNFL